MQIMFLLVFVLLGVTMTWGQQQIPNCSQIITESRVGVSPFQTNGKIWNATLVLPVKNSMLGWWLNLRFSRPFDGLGVNAGKDKHLEGELSEDNESFFLRVPEDTLLAESNLTIRFMAFYNDTGTDFTLVSVDFNDDIVCNDTNYVEPTTPIVTVNFLRVDSAGTDNIVFPGYTVPTRTSSSSPLENRSLRYDYKLVLSNSLLFYEAQRSGLLPINNRISWRGNSCTNDRGNAGEILVGGYYNNGRTMKFTFPLASTVTVLAWGMINYEAGYMAADQLMQARDALNWGATYLARCHTRPDELYTLVGDVQREIHVFWGRPEDINFHRPAYAVNRTSPGSEVAAETAAALAASSVALRKHGREGTTLSDLYLNHAKQLYEFANNYRGDYSMTIPQVANFYKSWNGDEDELVWAALWLFRATGEERYKTEAIDMYKRFNLKQREPKDFSWDDKVIGVRVLLSQMTLDTEHEEDAKKFCDDTVYNPDLHTPKGLFHIGRENPYLEFALKQVHYILGDTGRSFMIGFGTNYPRKPHHSASSCPDMPAPCGWEQHAAPGNNPQILIGALVGGPDRNDIYNDTRNNWNQNDVGIDYNAGFQSLIAGLMQLHETNLLPEMAYINEDS
ncbi:hypothetical protein B566_EDAN006094 [Ephemera danica]|nr:hypothetical protein B566_EDAN006094 [Ephemera danica]